MKEPTERGLPSNIHAERMVLGSILQNDAHFAECTALRVQDWSLSKHRTIWERMVELFNLQTSIDYVTLANELQRHDELESVDGITYLTGLTDGLPEIHNLEAYIAIVREKSKLRQVIQATRAAMNQALVAEDTPEKIIGGLLDTVQSIGEDESGKGLSSPAQIIETAEGGLDGLLCPQRGAGLATGFPGLDDRTGGFEPGQLVIVGARPSMGKTALLCNIAESMILRSDPRTVAIFSLETRKSGLLRRMAASLARVNLQKLRTGFTDADEQERLRQAAAMLYEAPLWIDDSSSSTLLDIRAKVQRLNANIRRTGAAPLGMVGVDYLQLMPVIEKRNSNREQDVSALSRGLKLLAKDANVPVVALSQLSRKCDERPNHEPQKSDLRESGAIEQDADLILFPYRAEVYQLDREDLHGVAELIIAKQKDGPVGRVPLTWLGEYTRFESRDE